MKNKWFGYYVREWASRTGRAWHVFYKNAAGDVNQPGEVWEHPEAPGKWFAATVKDPLRAKTFPTFTDAVLSLTKGAHFLNGADDYDVVYGFAERSA